jgi:hypothetical protein
MPVAQLAKYNKTISAKSIDSLISKYDLPDDLVAKNYTKADVVKAELLNKDEEKSLENLKKMAELYTQRRKILVEKCKVLAKHLKEGFTTELEIRTIGAEVISAYHSFKESEAGLFKGVNQEAKETAKAVKAIHSYSSAFV